MYTQSIPVKGFSLPRMKLDCEIHQQARNLNGQVEAIPCQMPLKMLVQSVKQFYVGSAFLREHFCDHNKL